MLRRDWWTREKGSARDERSGVLPFHGGRVPRSPGKLWGRGQGSLSADTQNGGLEVLERERERRKSE